MPISSQLPCDCTSLSHKISTINVNNLSIHFLIDESGTSGEGEVFLHPTAVQTVEIGLFIFLERLAPAVRAGVLFKLLFHLTTQLYIIDRTYSLNSFI